MDLILQLNIDAIKASKVRSNIILPMTPDLCNAGTEICLLPLKLTPINGTYSIGRLGFGLRGYFRFGLVASLAL